MRIGKWVMVLLFGCACTAGPPRASQSSDSLSTARLNGPVELPSGHETQRLVAGMDSKRPVGACELLRILDGGGGIFRVARMTTRVEVDSDSNAAGTFTYVELILVESWVGGTPEKVIARVDGGELPDGEISSSSVSMSRGDVLGILLYAPRPKNLGYYQLDSLGVFRPNDRNGYSNGQLFVGERLSLSDVWNVLRANADGICRQDILPPTARPSQPPADRRPTSPPRENAEIHEDTAE